MVTKIGKWEETKTPHASTRPSLSRRSPAASSIHVSIQPACAASSKRSANKKTCRRKAPPPKKHLKTKRNHNFAITWKCVFLPQPCPWNLEPLWLLWFCKKAAEHKKPVKPKYRPKFCGQNIGVKDTFSIILQSYAFASPFKTTIHMS